MNRTIYTVIFYLASPLIWFYFIWRAIKAPEYREGFLQRLGVLSKVEQRGIIVHCASVGETRAAIPLIKQLIADYPQLPITITNTTPTGKKVIEEVFGQKAFCQEVSGKSVGEKQASGKRADETQIQQVYLPIDWPGSCQRFIQSLRPRLVILMETELWPNLLHQLKRKEVPVLLANARLSKKSMKKYSKHPALTKTLFDNVSLVAAQYKSDVNNFLALGVEEKKVKQIGSIKFDLQVPAELKQRQKQLKELWAERRPVWVAASIHPGEFEQILETHRKLLAKMPDLLLIGIPRHPEKFADFKNACENSGLNFISRSEARQPDNNTQIVVGDTMGEMMLFCGIADIVFVGGSLIERGGQNPLEAIACGAPVMIGHSYYNFADVCQILDEQGVLISCKNAAELEHNIHQLLNHPERLIDLSAKAAQIMAANRGCVDRLSSLSRELLNLH
ncbi:3-deoxy-D-manno-octulosonic acid transferase [Aliikangiella coralliicola]|uniref:3-deoxy-D-manno-octulosonic acid transferase n=1 Tax=Aliikangiella coralliicola TaxID=2592383 RepID=A0A545TW45_9GAMM|nr:3-deoxy-D-manno-octulosonic acid transferase [Aliikangiella coralliicola]TQV81422.1 3-deoxy-D-manno-octulosonic acid transferase [Aliikangiella coralliicola]